MLCWKCLRSLLTSQVANTHLRAWQTARNRSSNSILSPPSVACFPTSGKSCQLVAQRGADLTALCLLLPRTPKWGALGWPRSHRTGWVTEHRTLRPSPLSLPTSHPYSKALRRSRSSGRPLGGSGLSKGRRRTLGPGLGTDGSRHGAEGGRRALGGRGPHLLFTWMRPAAERHSERRQRLAEWAAVGKSGSGGPGAGRMCCLTLRPPAARSEHFLLPRPQPGSRSRSQSTQSAGLAPPRPTPSTPRAPPAGCRRPPAPRSRALRRAERAKPGSLGLGPRSEPGVTLKLLRRAPGFGEPAPPADLPTVDNSTLGPFLESH